MSPDRILLALAGLAGEDGYAVPQIASDQARRAAEQLIAAAGLTRVEPQQAIAADPAPVPEEAPVTAPAAPSAFVAPTVLASTIGTAPVLPPEPGGVWRWEDGELVDALRQPARHRYQGWSS